MEILKKVMDEVLGNLLQPTLLYVVEVDYMTSEVPSYLSYPLILGNVLDTLFLQMQALGASLFSLPILYILLLLSDPCGHAGMADGYVYSCEFSSSFARVTFDGPLLWL